MDEQRKKILVRRDDFDWDQFDGYTLAEAAEGLQALIDYTYQKEIDLGYAMKFTAEPYGYDGGASWYIEVWRMESDIEYTNRLNAEAREAEKRAAKAAEKREKRRMSVQAQLDKIEAEERAELARLAEKYGAVYPRA